MKKLFWDDYLEEFTGLSIAIIFFVVLIGVLSIPVILSQINCKKAYQAYNPQWQILSGCRIEWKGKLTPVRMIRNINI